MTTESAQYFEQAYRDLKKSQHFHKPEDFEDGVELIQLGGLKGDPLIFDPRMEFRKGEVTVWAGSNGNGKSLVTSQVALQLAREGSHKVAIISLEMSPERTLYRMWRQFLGHTPTPEDSAKDFLTKLQERMTLLNVLGDADTEVILGAIVVAGLPFTRDGWGCDHIFVDNLMCVVHGDNGEKALNEQKDFVNILCQLAKALRVHIHLVHHVKKQGSEEDRVGKFDIKGSGAITDRVDNCILIQRNKAKEKKANDHKLSYQEDADAPDSWLTVCKQRNGDWEGEVSLWFDPASAAFCANPDRKIRWFLDEK